MCRIVACPEELLALLVCLDFLGSIQFAGKLTPCQVVDNLGIMHLQLLYQAVHLGMRKEIHHLLTVLLTEFLQTLGIGSVEGEHYLVDGIFVSDEAHTGLGELLLVHVDLYDIAEDLHSIAQMLRLHLRDAERALRLRESWHIGVKNVKECSSCRCIPHLVIHDHQHLIGPAAGLGQKSFLGASRQQHNCSEQTHRSKPLNILSHLCISFLVDSLL